MVFFQVYGRLDDGNNPHFHFTTKTFCYNAMILVMTSDWTDEAKTIQVAEKLREAGVTNLMRYKPDICTALQIFRWVDTLCSIQTGLKVLFATGVFQHFIDIGIFYGHLVIFFPILVCYTKKNLATLIYTRLV
jgi:hypothetical protein